MNWILCLVYVIFWCQIRCSLADSAFWPLLFIGYHVALIGIRFLFSLLCDMIVVSEGLPSLTIFQFSCWVSYLGAVWHVSRKHSKSCF